MTEPAQSADEVRVRCTVCGSSLTIKAVVLAPFEVRCWPCQAPMVPVHNDGEADG